MLIEKYEDEDVDQVNKIRFKSTISDKKIVDDDEVDQKKLLNDWKEMTNVHHFIGILKRHNVDRQQAFRLVGCECAEEFSIKKWSYLKRLMLG